jgi:hypothetical protein
MASTVNPIPISLHSEGMTPCIVNFAEWLGRLISRLRRQVAKTADPIVKEQLDEVSAHPAPKGAARSMPFNIGTSLGVASFHSTHTVFGTTLDVILSELALELFFAADAAAMRGEPGRDQATAV